jgi:LuxR family maltose regulon positive regulatory protein
MGSPLGLVATKLRPPAPRRDVVPRPALLSALEEGVSGRLVLLAASAGFGKTTLLTQWLASPDPRAATTAWVSLDAADSDPSRFWLHVLTAVDRIVPGTAESSGSDHAVTGLVNALAAHGDEVVIVLDDYHAVDNPDIHRDVAFLVENLPSTAHLIIATRADPSFPVARLRARGQLCELRTADLRLTAGEAAAFLTTTMKLHLTGAQSDVLHRRTDGWLAGLQLAGLALRNRPDAVESFLADFTGTDRFIIDYLAQEVLHDQPAAVLAFLRKTMILQRMCGPLCEAVAGAGQDMLEALEQQNLFVVPLDSQRRWYRYHPLFTDVLRARLGPPDPDLHRRASAWFAAAGELPEAIDHAIAIPDLERVADLLEGVPRIQFLTPVETALHRWLAALPPDVVRRRPALALLEAWTRLQTGDLTGARELMDTAAAAAVEADTVGEIAVLRGFLQMSLGRMDPVAVRADADEALARLAPDNITFRGMAHMVLGQATLLLGDGPATENALSEAQRLGRAGDAPHVAVMGGVYLTAAQRARGRYRQATDTARDAVEWTARHRTAVAGRVGLLHGQLADLALERGDPAAAAVHADHAVAAGRLVGVPNIVGYGLLAQARVRFAAGDLDGAVAELPSNPLTDAFRAQVALARGDVAAATRWADAQPTPTVDLLGGPRPGAFVTAIGYECEHVRVAPAQVWLAAGRVRDALTHLAVQARVAERFDLGWLRIKVAVLQALAHAADGDQARALDRLDEAIDLAQPERHIQLFATEGAPVAALLIRVRQTRIGSGRGGIDYLDAVLAACSPPSASTTVLSDRELDVLLMIAEGCDNRQIARRLFVAPSTVKTHVNRIFGKLGVTSRTQAVARGRQLGLL